MITVYGVTLSPYVRKAAAGLIEKGLDFDVEPLMPGDKTPEFRAISPFGRIPGLKDGDFTFADSTAILAYLDKKQPAPLLYPNDARKMARTVWFEEFADTQMIPAIASYFVETFIKPKLQNIPTNQAEADRQMQEILTPFFAYVESQLNGNKFIVGDDLSAADLAIATGFVNLRHVGYTPDKGKFPKLASYVDGILARPSFMRLYAEETKMTGGSQ